MSEELSHKSAEFEILFRDKYICVCQKPAGVLSTDDPGGMPELIRKATNVKDVFVVHRLDREVGGLCVYAMTQKAAAILSSQIADGTFEKEYYAVCHGCPSNDSGRMDDLLYHDPRTNKTFCVDKERKGVREASLEYMVTKRCETTSHVKIRLLTGRTHQIRAQFSSRKLPLCGDRRYGAGDDGWKNIALFSHRLAFIHPKTGERVEFERTPWW